MHLRSERRLSISSSINHHGVLSVTPFADVVPGQLQEARARCGGSVRAGGEESGQKGEGRPLEALHPQGAVHALARLLGGPDQHRPHLQAGHQGDQVGRVHLGEGEGLSSANLFKV